MLISGPLSITDTPYLPTDGSYSAEKDPGITARKERNITQTTFWLGHSDTAKVIFSPAPALLEHKQVSTCYCTTFFVSWNILMLFLESTDQFNIASYRKRTVHPNYECIFFSSSNKWSQELVRRTLNVPNTWLIKLFEEWQLPHFTI